MQSTGLLGGRGHGPRTWCAPEGAAAAAAATATPREGTPGAAAAEGLGLCRFERRLIPTCSSYTSRES